MNERPRVLRDEDHVLVAKEIRRLPVRELSARQRDVLQLTAEGKSAKEAGAILNISPRTVEYHKARIMKQSGLSTIANVIEYYADESGRSAPELSARQREVLQLTADGKSAKEAGRVLNISPKTIAYHRTRIMKQLGLSTAVDLIKYAMSRGPIPSHWSV